MGEKIIRTTTQVNLVFLITQVFIIISIWRFLPSEIPLFYSRPWGHDQLVSYPGIITLPAVCLIVFFTNAVIAQLAAKEESLIKKMLSLTSLTFTLLILISLIQIIRLVT